MNYTHEYCTLSEVAAAIDCCTRTASRRLHTAGYTPIRNGRVNLFLRAALSDIRVIGPR